MGEINIPREERDVLKAIDVAVLEKLIGQSVGDKRADCLRMIRLSNCGPFVASKFRSFEKALVDYDRAISPKKCAETEAYALRTGRDLASAVRQMKYRVETEEREGQLFYVEDNIAPPYDFSDDLSVHVSYRWRPTIEDAWRFGSITFSHDVNWSADYTVPLTRRKPSALEQKQDRRDKLCGTWNHLMSLGVQSVRNYFRDGGDGDQIPRAFPVKVDSYTRGLNNFSATFWREQP
ncbi:MAG: hypothetical protein JSR92_16300 [Proteobacteria bacterium]|nr:hypothetical protein [Pseudomonadota bacterium]